MIKFRDHSKLIMHLISLNNCGRNSEYENTSDEVSIVVDRGLNSSENEEKTFDDFIVFQCGKEQFFIRYNEMFNFENSILLLLDLVSLSVP